jgi:hypothetical protein
MTKNGSIATKNGSKETIATKNGSKEIIAERARVFAEVYNDVKTYPTRDDVARALNRTEKTVRNFSAILRARHLAGEDVPELTVDRSIKIPGYAATESKEPVLQLSPREHAHRRANALELSVRDLLSRSDYPVVNPEALVIRSHITTRYDRVSGERGEAESTPRTWLTDTLRVAARPEQRNKTFIFSGAQNDAPVHQRFWDNLNAYAADRDAEIIIGPWTYETSWWSENTPSSRAYDPLLERHLCFGQMKIGDTFMFCGEMNTLPTATKPISDLTSYAQGRWTVFPHSKVQLASVPASNPMEQAFQVMSTGAVTIPMVVPRKAGVKSLSEHRIAATIVEFDHEGDLFCRQLMADDLGDFQDLDTRVTDGVVSRGYRIDGFTPGDLHSAKMKSANSRAVFGFTPGEASVSPGSVLDTLRPRWVTLHDIHDHEARNHHNQKDVSHNFEMAHRGRESIQGELQISVDFLEKLARPGLDIYIVESNHDIALDRYVREGRYRMDGVNYRFGLTLDVAYHDWRADVAEALDAQVSPREFSLLEWALRHLSKTKLKTVKWIYDGKSKIMNGVQVGYHGFRGVNGSKGTVGGYARLGHAMTVGDKHSPSIMGNVYGAGVMELEHGYNKGPTGWCVTHVLQYENGTRSLMTMQKHKWRAFY